VPSLVHFLRVFIIASYLAVVAELVFLVRNFFLFCNLIVLHLDLYTLSMNVFVYVAGLFAQCCIR
jgi:hypothetical protein